MDFSDWLNKQMNEKGWSQAELARRAGINRQVVSNYINKQREKPDYDILIAIARALNIPPETIFRAAGLLTPVSPDTEYEKRLIYLVRMLNDRYQKQILDYAEWLLNQQQNEESKSVLHK